MVQFSYHKPNLCKMGIDYYRRPIYTNPLQFERAWVVHKAYIDGRERLESQWRNQCRTEEHGHEEME